MLGAICGDVIGSTYEKAGIKNTDFELLPPGCTFTDDTVCTVAVAAAILDPDKYRAAVFGDSTQTNLPVPEEGDDGPDAFGFATALREFGNRYPDAGYGQMFKEWLQKPTKGPYNSWGNGGAMRVSPVGFSAMSEEQALSEASITASITHNHPQGVAGAQAVALAIFLARTGASKDAIRSRIAQQFGYDLSGTVDDIRPGYSFDVSAQGSVPQSILAFLDGDSWEECVRLAVSLGGDADTMASIAGALAEAYYGTEAIPAPVVKAVLALLPRDFSDVLRRFQHAFPLRLSLKGQGPPASPGGQDDSGRDPPGGGGGRGGDTDDSTRARDDGMPKKGPGGAGGGRGASSYNDSSDEEDFSSKRQKTGPGAVAGDGDAFATQCLLLSNVLSGVTRAAWPGLGARNAVSWETVWPRQVVPGVAAAGAPALQPRLPAPSAKPPPRHVAWPLAQQLPGSCHVAASRGASMRFPPGEDASMLPWCAGDAASAFKGCTVRSLGRILALPC